MRTLHVVRMSPAASPQGNRDRFSARFGTPLLSGFAGARNAVGHRCAHEGPLYRECVATKHPLRSTRPTPWPGCTPPG